jgi:hypothetical protein
MKISRTYIGVVLLSVLLILMVLAKCFGIGA